jgi:hypothetical protein
VIGGEVVEINLRVVSQEGVHGIALMPASPSDMEVDPPAGEAADEGPEESDEAGGVAARDARQLMPALQEGHPARAVQSLPMGTGRGHPEPGTPAHPAPPQARMEAESGLVGEPEDRAFAGQDSREFFEPPPEAADALPGRRDQAVPGDLQHQAQAAEPVPGLARLELDSADGAEVLHDSEAIPAAALDPDLGRGPVQGGGQAPGHGGGDLGRPARPRAVLDGCDPPVLASRIQAQAVTRLTWTSRAIAGARQLARIAARHKLLCQPLPN